MSSAPKVVSMVPSWTETLVACGANVVGRTRFCIHPKEKIPDIQAVGGTKDIDWQKVENLGADLILLDEEENPREMASSAKIPYLATHITNVDSVARELSRLREWFLDIGDIRVAENLANISERWRVVATREPRQLVQWKAIPGVLNWIREPASSPSDAAIVYVIWRKPWMHVTSDTFIGSMLQQIGFSRRQIWQPREVTKRYPEFKLGDLPDNAVLFMSSEPYPFLKMKDWVAEIHHPTAVVNGESFSWFGIRSLKFLEGF